MDHIAAAEERLVNERLRQKLNEVNAAAQSHLAGVQDHINFTLQQAYFKCAYECFDRSKKQDEIGNCVEHCSVPVLNAQNLVENEMAKFQEDAPTTTSTSLPRKEGASGTTMASLPTGESVSGTTTSSLPGQEGTSETTSTFLLAQEGAPGMTMTSFLGREGVFGTTTASLPRQEGTSETTTTSLFEQEGALRTIMTSLPEQEGPLGINVRLNGDNNIFWSRSFEIFLGSQNKLVHIQSGPLDPKDANYASWQQADYCVMTWLLNSMEESIMASVIFSKTAKEMWDTWNDIYSHEKNVSLVFELYEKLFSLKQDGRSVIDYFTLLKGIVDEIVLYRPLHCDAQTRKSQWEEFMVAKFFSGLDNTLQPVRDHFLASDTALTLSNAFSHILRVSTSRSLNTASKTSSTAVRGCGPPQRGGYCSERGRMSAVSRRYHNNHNFEQCRQRFAK